MMSVGGMHSANNVPVVGRRFIRVAEASPMTDSQLRFEIPFGRKSITAGFDGGSISSDGGLLLLRRIDEWLGLTKRLARCVKDGREQRKVEQSIRDMLVQRVSFKACEKGRGKTGPGIGMSPGARNRLRRPVSHRIGGQIGHTGGPEGLFHQTRRHKTPRQTPPHGVMN